MLCPGPSSHGTGLGGVSPGLLQVTVSGNRARAAGTEGLRDAPWSSREPQQRPNLLLTSPGPSAGHLSVALLRGWVPG